MQQRLCALLIFLRLSQLELSRSADVATSTVSATVLLGGVVLNDMGLIVVLSLFGFC